jgi:acyl carrier protein
VRYQDRDDDRGSDSNQNLRDKDATAVIVAASFVGNMTAGVVAVAGETLRLARDERGHPGEPPAPDAALASALDSLQLLSLVVAVEDRFRIAIEDDDAAGIRSLADLARLVAARADAALLPSVPERAP